MDYDATAKLYKRFHKPVRAWLRKRLGCNLLELDDLAQEVFIRLLRFDSKGLVDNPAGYLFKIASNVVNDWDQLVRNRDPHDPEWLDELTIESPLIEDLEQSELNEYVSQLLAELPPRNREMLMLHVYEGLTYNQIAERTGTTYRTVMRRLVQSYSYLRFKVTNDETRDYY